MKIITAWTQASWLVGFNVTLTAKVISWSACMCFLSFSHQYEHNFLFKATNYFSHKSCFSRGVRRKYARKKYASTGYQTHNHQVMSLTRSPLSHPGGAGSRLVIPVQTDIVNASNPHFTVHAQKMYYDSFYSLSCMPISSFLSKKQILLDLFLA